MTDHIPCDDCSRFDFSCTGKCKEKKTVAEILEQGAQTFRERNAVYGDNYLRVGKMMEAMFPQGLTIKTAKDWNRVHFLLLSVVKQSRYATNFEKGGHADSIHDAMVYCAFLEMMDASSPDT